LKYTKSFDPHIMTASELGQY